VGKAAISPAGGYSVTGDTCSNQNFPQGRHSCTVTVRFLPTEAKLYAATLSLPATFSTCAFTCQSFDTSKTIALDGVGGVSYRVATSTRGRDRRRR
jgi:hypothetical protein